MKEITGNIWGYYDKGNWVVITTNGTVKKNGEAVMGRGVALEAKKRFPKFPATLGKFLNSYGNLVFTSNLTDEKYEPIRLITFPTKNSPFEKSDMDLIERSAKQLAYVVPGSMTVYMVRPGCGNGGLDWKDVKPVLEKYLDDRFVVVERK